MPDVDDIFGSDSSGDEGQAQEAVADDGPADVGTLGDQAAPADEDLFGSDSDVGANEGPRESPTSPKAAVSGMMDTEVDPFADSDDDAGSRPIAVKTLGRLSKGGGTKEKRDKGGKGKKKKGDKLKKKKDKKRKRLSAGTDGDNENRQGTGTNKEKKKKMKKAQELEDLGLLSSGDDEEVEADLEPEEKGALDDEAEPETNEARTRDDDDFIDNTDDNPDLLEEYNHDAPPAGSDSEAEEDNRADIREDAPPQESAMDAVLKSMKRRKSQELSTAEREQIAQEFMYKINKASEDDEKAVKEGKPALNKLKMLKVMKATLAKKELQETFLEFDLLGVIARWLQPYKNGHLPNLTIRKEMLALVMNLPVQVDHLKRSGIGKIIMRLLNCKEETRENKIVIRELVSKWNRPVYGQDASYRAMRSMQEEPEAIEVTSSGSTSNSARRRMGATWNARKRENPSRDEAVGNILSAAKAGAQASPGMRVPFSNGYAFSKAPKSRLESNGRQPVQQVDTSARSKLLKKMATLSRPVKKGV